MRSGHLAGLLLALTVGLNGCATVAQPNPADPAEGWNRGVQRFNDAVDDAVLRPVAEAYVENVPELIRTGVGNFYGNLLDGWSSLNHFLQGKPQYGLEMGMRTLVNSVWGLGGILDPASEMGLERRAEDLGQTLGRWGVGPGPYLVLPLLGPSTLRDTAALPFDLRATSISLITGDRQIQFGTTIFNVVHTRARVLGASRLLESIALDEYSFLRDAYLARRRNMVYDGDPPEERFDTPSQ